jgi:transcriptional regulator of acetoin/glycerol metabolism
VSPRPSLFEALERHPWPGNVRELHNALEALVARFAGQSVGADEILSVLETPRRSAGDASLAEPPPDAGGDRERIRWALERCGGNVARAARELGVPRTTLRDRLRRWSPRRPATHEARDPGGARDGLAD